MENNIKHNRLSLKPWLILVILFWAITSGIAGYFISQTLFLNQNVLELRGKLKDLQNNKIKWEQFKADYEKAESKRIREAQEVAERNLQRRKLADDLIKQAQQLESQKNLYSAIKVYSEAVISDPNSIEALNSLEKVVNETKLQQEKAKYIEKIQLYDFIAKLYESFLEEPGPGIEFKLKNNGDRTLKEITVTVYFKDVDGKKIYQESWYPISSYRDPLRPGYIWQLERGKFYPARKVPTEWKPGPDAAYAEVTDIEFAED